MEACMRTDTFTPVQSFNYKTVRQLYHVVHPVDIYVYLQ